MKTYLRILNFCKPYKAMILISIISSFLFALLNALSIWLVGSLITSIMLPASNPNKSDDSMFSSFESFLNPSNNPRDSLELLCILLLVTFLLKNIFFYINNISLAYVQTKMIVDVRNKLFNHIMYLPLSFFHKNKTGELTSIAINDVTNMRVAFANSVQSLINQPISLIVMLVMLFMISVKLSLIVFIGAPISLMVITVLANSIKRKAMRSSIQIAGLTTILQEMLTGIKIVKSFTAESKEKIKFSISNNKFFKLIMKEGRLVFLNAPINEMIGVSLGVTLLYIGGLEVLASSPQKIELESEKFVRFIIFLFAMLQPVRKITGVASTMQLGIASAERVFSILDININTSDSKKSNPIDKFNSSITFENVSFTYDSSKKPAVQNLNFKINKGEYVALIGSSGAGKSTTIDLMMRFHGPQKGSIKFDDTNLKDISKKALRKKIGIVPQDTILFNDTISNNISYGSDNDDFEKIKRASKAANALDFINDLPDGFETIVGERGAKLSGGQKQRISIARAIFKNPEILILDEATSALDSELENKVKEAIDNIVKDRTVIVIAHRLSTIINADKILVFNDGEIADSGRHKDLIKNSDIYKKLYNSQFKSINE
tara:strand:+ start:6303 stop:8120 length:1818 start_codon:yes stop_codon:yes gene_type:complete